MYRTFLARAAATLPEIAGELDVPVDALENGATLLVDIGLLRTAGERYVAINPMLAEATVLGAEELELSSRRAAIEARRTAIRQAIPDWLDVARQDPLQSSADVILDPESISNVLMHYAERCRDELLSVSPGRLPTGRVDDRTRMANVYASDRGVKTRALYQHMALRDRATRAYLRDMVDHGAKIRLAPSVPGRSLVIDRQVALLPITGEGGSPGLAIVREPNVINWVVSTFEQLWVEAAPLDDMLGAKHDDVDLDQTRVAILRLMSDGEKDEAISRRLSISVRTCRRHIADYMLQVGATSRFQAGVTAARSGHLDYPSVG